MKKQLFNSGWKVERGVKDPFEAMRMPAGNETEVQLPHDAMIYEKRDARCESGNQSGYYPAGTYTYTKEFDVPHEWEDIQVKLEFEGVMSQAMVYINEEFAGSHSYGYSQFYIDMKPYLIYGEVNKIRVIAVNREKSSRWYSGSGIYRNVNLLTGKTVLAEPEGIRITTVDLEEDYAVVTVDAVLTNTDTKNQVVDLQVILEDSDGVKVAGDINKVSLPALQTMSSHMRLTVSRPRLWTVEQPFLYTCRIGVTDHGKALDESAETFGIRTLKLDARQGLRINGETVKLRGACIHHDNGIIGACTLEKAEEYRCRKLKEAGFNSIRSSHHPLGKAMLEACDKIGILVVDELCDMWNMPKNSNDFSFHFSGQWEDEVKRLVAKDYNHPCVIMYSIGNEIPEIGRMGGRVQNRKLAGLLRSCDTTRYVTSGVNGFLAMAGGRFTAEDFGMSEKQMEELTQSADQGDEQEAKEAVGSEALNDVMGDIPMEMRDAYSLHPLMTSQLEESSCELDVVGLNYMTARHEFEHTMHPDRIVMGSETYPKEIPALWRIVEQNPHVIGDFTWTGYDYLGEAGIGAYHYDAMPKGQGIYPDRLAYCGDINLNGCRRPVSYLREIVFGLRKQPFIEVERVDRYGYGCLRNHWKYGDSLDSWTFPGYEGKLARVKVLSPSEEVELFLNGVSLGRKEAGAACEFAAVYEITYQPGELTAVGYDGGAETGRMSLITAGAAAQIIVRADTVKMQAGGQDAVILEISMTDENGIINMWEEREVTISITGSAVLQGFGSANPSSEGSYQSMTCKTFDGRLMAVLRSGMEPGSAEIKLSSDGMEDAVLQIPVE